MIKVPNQLELFKLDERDIFPSHTPADLDKCQAKIIKGKHFYEGWVFSELADRVDYFARIVGIKVYQRIIKHPNPQNLKAKFEFSRLRQLEQGYMNELRVGCLKKNKALAKLYKPWYHFFKYNVKVQAREVKVAPRMVVEKYIEAALSLIPEDTDECLCFCSEKIK